MCFVEIIKVHHRNACLSNAWLIVVCMLVVFIQAWQHSHFPALSSSSDVVADEIDEHTDATYGSKSAICNGGALDSNKSKLPVNVNVNKSATRRRNNASLLPDGCVDNSPMPTTSHASNTENGMPV